MEPSLIHDFHTEKQARFSVVNGMEVVADYGDSLAEQDWLAKTAAVVDLSFRGRLCLTGADRLRFLHGQVTNDVNRLEVGQGCYAALITAKGKMVSDLQIYRLRDELLLDFEPGLTSKIIERLEHYIIADDVQIADVASLYGLLTVQGPRALDVIKDSSIFGSQELHAPGAPMSFLSVGDSTSGEIYLMNHARLGTFGYDIFTPVAGLRTSIERLVTAASGVGGGLSGCLALDRVRIEAGIPRFGVDMDESNLPSETGLEARIISYGKGCYIGQEVLARIRTYGQVAKSLRRLEFSAGLAELPAKGDKLFKEGKEVGYVTSSVQPSHLQHPIGLGYVRRESNALGTLLSLRTSAGESSVRVGKVPGASESSPVNPNQK